jgi:hypothetical protein
MKVLVFREELLQFYNCGTQNIIIFGTVKIQGFTCSSWSKLLVWHPILIFYNKKPDNEEDSNNYCLALDLMALKGTVRAVKRNILYASKTSRNYHVLIPVESSDCG